MDRLLNFQTAIKILEYFVCTMSLWWTLHVHNTYTCEIFLKGRIFQWFWYIDYVCPWYLGGVRGATSWKNMHFHDSDENHAASLYQMTPKVTTLTLFENGPYQWAKCYGRVNIRDHEIIILNRSEPSLPGHLQKVSWWVMRGYKKNRDSLSEITAFYVLCGNYKWVCVGLQTETEEMAFTDIVFHQWIRW